MAKRPPENNRRALIDQQRKKARAKERRATVLTIVITSIIGIAMLVAVIMFGRDGKGINGPDLEAVGVTAEAAACGESKEEAIAEKNEHTPQNGDPVNYTVAPPTSGNHSPTPLPFGKRFYSRDENPPPERAVHNLEHGYIVVWYDSKVTDAQVSVLEEAASGAEGKFLVVPWTRGDFPGDKHIVLTSWGQKQECGDVSGAVMKKFQDNHGGNKSKAPEKNAV